MTKILRMKNTLLFALCMIIPIGAEAQRADSLRWIPDWGAELVTEQQVTNEGGYRSVTKGDAFLRKNCANLLRLQASLPIARGFSLDVGSISTFMTAKESIGGDLQTFSNLDAGNIPFALSVCNLVLNVGERHSLSLGIRNMNEDYFCSDVTSLFTNSSCGIYPTISANYPIANYPLASVGVHYRYEGSRGSKCSRGSNGSMVFQTSLYNGKGYNRFTGRENVFRFCPKDDGLFGLAEVQYHRGGSSYFVGSSVYWGGYSNNIKGVGADDAGVSFTPWAYAEQRVTDRLSLIAGYSHAFGPDAACRDFAGLGGRYTWERAELGLFTDYARFAEGDEFATELTCKVALTPHLYLQPTVHAIFMPDPSTGSGQTDAALFHGAATLRLGVEF